MHRDILIACLPCFVVLCAGMLMLRSVLALGVASWNWRRLTQMHRCQRGGVQSLAFVLTMPIFVMVVLLIVQVSQLMIAQMVIHYAAFAGTRAASVWLPAAVDDPSRELDEEAEVENRVNDRPTASDGDYTTFEASSSSRSQKLWKIRAAVIQALAPLAPSRDLGAVAQMKCLVDVIYANQQMYSTLLPASKSNSRIPVRMTNKLNYTDQNTRVVVEWRDCRNGRERNSLDNTSSQVSAESWKNELDGFGRERDRVAGSDHRLRYSSVCVAARSRTVSGHAIGDQQCCSRSSQPAYQAEIQHKTHGLYNADHGGSDDHM